MTDYPVKRRNKLIEVAIPLEAINAASAKEKSIRHGHPSTLHLWWARRPLAAARAVIFCQMVDDPSAVPEEFSTEEDQENERLRLFALISELVTWENTTNDEVLDRAREEIWRSWRRCCADNADHPEAAEIFNPKKLPGFHDPFAGGGALPLEAQRLGLQSVGSDINPVAVLINKALIEIPSLYSFTRPISPALGSKELFITNKPSLANLAKDIEYYGAWMHEKAKRLIGQFFPEYHVTADAINGRIELKQYEGKTLPVVAWLWARTVKSPNPFYSEHEVPLISTFVISKKKSRAACIRLNASNGQLKISIDHPENEEIKNYESGTKLGRGANFKCALSGDLITGEYIKNEGKAGRIGQKLIAVVCKVKGKRIYMPPCDDHEKIIKTIKHQSGPIGSIPERLSGGTCVPYGLEQWKDLYTQRHLLVINTYSKLLDDVKNLIDDHLANANILDPDKSLTYKRIIITYLALAVSKLCDSFNSLVTWKASMDQPIHLFTRQSIPMVWDFAEPNAFGDAMGDLKTTLKGICRVIPNLPGNAGSYATHQEAQFFCADSQVVISTDPPYYDNIFYADVSDFFYSWLRLFIKDDYPNLFSTIATPKAKELVATPFRHGSKEKANKFFLEGMCQALKTIATNAHPGFPITIYYAFKQASKQPNSSQAVSTGWEAFLEAAIRSGLEIVGTWPARTELANRVVGLSANALASSVVLVCRVRKQNIDNISSIEFRRKIRRRLPEVIDTLEKANIAPVDVAQAAIGPGMAIFSQVKAVLNPDDSEMSVREALIEINIALDEYLSKSEGGFDEDTCFALTFFESYGYERRPFGDAEGLALARNVSVEGVSRAGILSAIGGAAQLLRREQLDDKWDPLKDDRLCVWEATQHLIRRLDTGGEASAAALLTQLKNLSGQGELAANCRALAYRLYNHCEKTKQTEEARAYNGLVIAWPELERLSASQASESAVQTSLI